MQISYQGSPHKTLQSAESRNARVRTNLPAFTYVSRHRRPFNSFVMMVQLLSLLSIAHTEYPDLPNRPVYATNGGTEININGTFIKLIPTDLHTPQCQWWVQRLY